MHDVNAYVHMPPERDVSFEEFMANPVYDSGKLYLYKVWADLVFPVRLRK